MQSNDISTNRRRGGEISISQNNTIEAIRIFLDGCIEMKYDKIEFISGMITAYRMETEEEYLNRLKVIAKRQLTQIDKKLKELKGE